MYLTLIVLPLLGSIVSGFFGRKVGVTGAHIITCTSVITTTLLAILALGVPRSLTVYPHNYTFP